MSTFAELPSVDDVLEGRYQITGHIGRGGMGTVLEGRHLSLGREVAIKLMHPTLTNNQGYVRRFEMEVQIAKELSHPNSVRIYDFGHTESGMMFLVMELLEGRELAEELEEVGPMSIARGLKLGRQLLDGLGEAHAMDVIHRDIKPGNLFLAQDKRQREILKILDFGIAKPAGGGHTAITRANELIGTARYLAPEVFVDGHASKTSDIYACGMVLWEMLLGRPLIDAQNIPAVFQQHLRLPDITPPILDSHPLAIVLWKAVTKNPGLRFVDAEEMLEALERIPESAELDRTIPQEQIEDIFSALHGDPSQQSERITVEAVTPGTQAKTSEIGDGFHTGELDTFTPQQTTKLLNTFVEQTSQEVGQFVATMGGSADVTRRIDPEALDRAVAATRNIANQFRDDLPEETVEVSEERTAAVMALVQRQNSSQAVDAPDNTTVATGELQFAESSQGTLELTDELLSEFSRAESAESISPQRTIELSEEMVLDAESGTGLPRSDEIVGSNRSTGSFDSDTDESLVASSNVDRISKMSLGIHPILLGAAVGLLILGLLYGLLLLVL